MKRNKKIFLKIFLSICSLIFSLSGLAQEPVKTPISLKYGSQRSGKRTDEAMNKWRANRFGQFIHWGLYAIPGGIWKGKTYPGAAEWLQDLANIPSAEWEPLKDQFNPTNFNAKAWAKMAKTMGVKYMVITTKHHDGFCLWDSKYTKFDVAETPYKKDIIRQVIEAYNAEGIDVGFYYSVLDWHHPDWRYELKSKEDEIAFARYLDFAKNQLRELAENYPTVKTFWFDGTWDKSVEKNGKWTYDIEIMLKQIRPGIIVNSRLRADDLGARHKDSNGQLMGDYESGYERRLPTAGETQEVTKWDWEACMTIPKNQWGYHKDWSLSHIKTPDEILEWIIKAASMGGNMLLNFGPQPDGDFRPEEKHIADSIGNWMKLNGEAVYGTDYAGLEPQNWGYYTKKTGTNKVYMIVFNIPISRKLKITLPDKTSIASYKMLNETKSLKLTDIGEQQFYIELPPDNFTQPFVIELELQQGNPKEAKDKALT